MTVKLTNKRQVSKTGKVFLYVNSTFPIFWTILILICSYFEISEPHLKAYFVISFVIYTYGGFWMWLLLITFLKWKNKITSKELIIQISIAFIGIIVGYLTLHFDFLGMIRRYFDMSLI